MLPIGSMVHQMRKTSLFRRFPLPMAPARSPCSPDVHRFSVLTPIPISPNYRPNTKPTAEHFFFFSAFPLRMPFSTATPSGDLDSEVWDMEWEAEEDVEPKVGDGGDGGGVVLGRVAWGQRALLAAGEILSQEFGDDIAMFAFKVSPRGYIYVRLDKLTNEYGCPSMEEIEKYNSLYKKHLDEIGQSGGLPNNLAVEVSSPGAERLLKVPEDLDRFKEMPMRVQYMEEVLVSKTQQQKDGIFMLESVNIETRHCVWKLANVKENKGEAGKGRPLSRKQKDWRLQLPFESTRRIMLYLN